MAGSTPTLPDRRKRTVTTKWLWALGAVAALAAMGGAGVYLWKLHELRVAEEKRMADIVPPPTWLDTDCRPGEMTDGRVLITAPRGNAWTTPDSVEYLSDDVPVFHFYSNQRTVTVCSAWDSDTTKTNFNEYWAGWQQQMEEAQARMLELKEMSYGKNLCRYKYMQYSFPDRSKIFWEFALLYYQPTGKVLLVSCWSFIRTAIGPSKVVGDLLRTARFEKEEE